jgi:RES domain-containing protein
MSALPADWVTNQALTQAVGLQWRERGQTLGLWVPSAVEPGDLNLVINPDHPQYRYIAVHVERNPFEFDPRMFN